MLKSPRKAYRLYRADRATAADGDVIQAFTQKKTPLRPGERITLFHQLKDQYLDRLALAGGEGVDILRRAKRQALREFKARGSGTTALQSHSKASTSALGRHKSPISPLLEEDCARPRPISSGLAEGFRVRARSATGRRWRFRPGAPVRSASCPVLPLVAPERGTKAPTHHGGSRLAEGVDDETWLFHLRSNDYSRWFRDAIKDDDLASEASGVEADASLSAHESRLRIKELVDRRYTTPSKASGRSD